MKTEHVLDIVNAEPGITGFQIWEKLIARSWMARHFGEASLLTSIFGPNCGSVYVHLAKLEGSGLISSHWGIATAARGGYRPRHYYPVPLT